ncbi:MAG: spheroidene monooxygenase [Roseovarius sp.]
MTQIVTLSLFRFDSLLSRLWALKMMGLARPMMARVPDIGFWKLCGSGTGEGFTPLPNTGVYAILATWPDMATARARTGGEAGSAAVFNRYRVRASEDWTLYMRPTSARGDWAGVQPFETGPETTPGPLAVLTRATVKPSRAARFWRRVPDISARIGADPNVLFKIGIGEVPLLHQVTFSVWPDAATVAQFARTGPHAEAIRAVRDEGWFREELYARFAIAGESGRWSDAAPIASPPHLPQRDEI